MNSADHLKCPASVLLMSIFSIIYFCPSFHILFSAGLGLNYSSFSAVLGRKLIDVTSLFFSDVCI
jgi:hypothetical protein